MNHKCHYEYAFQVDWLCTVIYQIHHKQVACVLYKWHSDSQTKNYCNHTDNRWAHELGIQYAQPKMSYKDNNMSNQIWDQCNLNITTHGNSFSSRRMSAKCVLLTVFRIWDKTALYSYTITALCFDTTRFDTSIVCCDTSITSDNILGLSCDVRP